MKKISRFGILLSLLIPSLLASQDWYSLNSDKGGFRIDFPKEPSLMEDNQIKGDIKLDLMIYKHENKEKRLSYFAAVTFYDIAYEDSSNIAMITAENYAHRWGGEQISVYEGKFGDSLSGYEVEIALNPITMMRARIFFINNKLYELVAAAPTENIHSPNIDIYFSSFELK